MCIFSGKNGGWWRCRGVDAGREVDVMYMSNLNHLDQNRNRERREMGIWECGRVGK